ncbi:MAG: leucyl aminopeptidase [Proteobacteria bacterium]|jgi:leucyl aminopeptidase|nr:leucyl aminopeptidase [Pseudomonadota bacterium]
MKTNVSLLNKVPKPTTCHVLFLSSDKALSAEAKDFDQQLNGTLSTLLKNGGLTPRAGHLTVIPAVGPQNTRLILVYTGKKANANSADYKKLCVSVASKLTSLSISSINISLSGLANTGIDFDTLSRHLLEAIGDARYTLTQQPAPANKPAKTKPLSIHFWVADKDQLKQTKIGCKQGLAISNGKDLARNLGNLPGNICTPSYLAKQARALGRSHNLKIDVLSEPEMKKLKMDSLLSVSRGSRQPAKLIVMHYRGAKLEKEQPHVLVGKGLTFDAGGISIKPAAKMDEMKYDMCGAASVFGAMQAIADMGLKINVTAVVPSSENLPDGDANKPGDIVKSMAGQTIEILNTDAEGRLILCDALTYSQRFKPKTVIDIATLTGAVIVALGSHASGVMGNDQDLVDDIITAGETSLDRAWQLPLWDEYQKQLDSNFADIANVGGRAAGTITAGCFLSRFANDFRWAHLDIAGTAWRSGGKQKGATGRAVPILTQYLIDQASK